MKNVRLLPLFTMLFLLGCQLQYNPWETSTDRYDCPSYLIQKNINALNMYWDNKETHDSLKIAVLSDTHIWYNEFAEAVDLINARSDIDFVIHAGDMTEYGLIMEYKWFTDIAERFNKPWFAVIGNHDCLSHGLDIYKEIFGMDKFKFSLEKDDSTKYNFVFINNNSLEINASQEYNNNVVNWINNSVVLPGYEGDNIDILTAHIPPTSNVYFDNFTINHIDTLLVRNDIEMFLYGHTHSFHPPEETKKPYYTFGADCIEKREYYIITFYGIIEETGKVEFRYEKVNY